MGLILLRFAVALGFGGGLATLFATRSIFAAAETREQGGRFSGAVLKSFLWLRWAGVALTALDPRRKRWRALHGTSVLLLLAQIACAGAGLAAQ